jgi:hypothetical protein
VRACTSTELSAFLSPECSLSTASFGGVSSGIALLPGSVPGFIYIINLLVYAIQLLVLSTYN